MERFISVQGNIIDLSLLYRITPVVGDNCWSSKDSKLSHSAFGFDLLFLNGKSMNISLNGSQCIPKKTRQNRDNQTVFVDWWYNYDEDIDQYLKDLKTIESQVEELRWKIVEKWTECKPSFTDIDFTYKTK